MANELVYTSVSLFILGIFITLFAVFNGVIYDVLDDTNKNLVKENFITFFWTSVAMVILLSLLSFFYIRLNPSHYQTYSMIVTHISLLLSLTGLSFSTLFH